MQSLDRHPIKEYLTILLTTACLAASLAVFQEVAAKKKVPNHQAPAPELTEEAAAASPAE